MVGAMEVNKAEGWEKNREKEGRGEESESGEGGVSVFLKVGGYDILQC